LHTLEGQGSSQGQEGLGQAPLIGLALPATCSVWPASCTCLWLPGAVVAHIPSYDLYDSLSAEVSACVLGFRVRVRNLPGAYLCCTSLLHQSVTRSSIQPSLVRNPASPAFCTGLLHRSVTRSSIQPSLVRNPASPAFCTGLLHQPIPRSNPPPSPGRIHAAPASRTSLL